MKKTIKAICFISIMTLFCLSTVSAEGSRYDLPRSYNSEISSAGEFLEMQTGTVLIDVRRLREYRAGHPINPNGLANNQEAYNVPFPHIVGYGDQDPQFFFDAVVAVITGLGGDENTPITTLCRTGFRSVLAANILTDPGAHGVTGTAFTNVRNIWEGFVGRELEAFFAPLGVDSLEAIGQTDLLGKGKKGVPHSLLGHEALHHNYLDLNNNGVIDEHTADVCTDTPDNNPDKDGWRNHQALPWGTGVSATYAYLGDTAQYPSCVSP
ncbi:rhodanese-like domain-containing protein [Solemya velum gill symbiont]|nr:rhodanese-like domain-containing protein [Solemya velum gill symbiont]